MPPPIPGNKPQVHDWKEPVSNPKPVMAVAGTQREFGHNVDSWDANKFHQLGDLVSHLSRVYKCITAHQGQVDWAPGAAVSLWELQ